ncbi:hypothetical protein RJ640_010011 [Escallonia rubra]|uniref:Retrovirus-related Pol polyprotein from transposon TNT 1-94-like beta-barrel domain-containing protein n=1 Tax=Escallonia rubra TaxID=112253 RepID=A0AA88R3Z1_9ASTE|nr:hypothetical protein RJ640_010011 [Escallonia rubra]
MSNNTTMKYACEQFKGKMNFGIWQSKVKDILVQQGLLKPLLGNKPESMDQDDWEELQAKAVSTIRLNLAPKLRMDEGSDLGDHISEFNRLVSQLSSIDVKLEEEDQSILLLSSLPKSYETLKTTLLIGKETLLVDDVMSALMDSSRVNGTSSSNQGDGLVVRSENKNGHGRGRGRSRSKNSGHGNDRSKSRGKHDKSSIECWYFKEIGYIARKCPERKDKKNGKKHVNNANVAEEDDKSSDGDLYLVSSVEQQEGTIKIKMFDGIVRTLGDVRYIPDLKKNLISLGTLDSIDCSISIKGGVMKVSKGAMVIMKGQKTGNLHKLMGKTVIGGALVSTHAGSSNDNSKLWHKRLGHLSEGELHEQRTKSTDESTDGSTDEQSLEDPDEHPSDSWNLVRDREPRTKKPTQRKTVERYT